MWKKVKTITKIIMAGVVLLAAAAAIWIFAETKLNKRRLDVRVVRVEELTKFRRVPHLTGNFVYNGRPVDRLWEVDIVISNSGTDTLVGVGDKKDLIGDSLIFGFVKGEAIIDYFEEDNEPNVDLRTINSKCFVISFKQWRPKEEYSLSFYISTGVDYRHIPTPVVISDREIIDGEIRVLTLTAPPEEKIPGDRFINKWTGYTTATITLVSFLLYYISSTIVLRRREKEIARIMAQRDEIVRSVENVVIKLESVGQKGRESKEMTRRKWLLRNIENKLRALFPDATPHAEKKRAKALAGVFERALGPSGRDVATMAELPLVDLEKLWLAVEGVVDAH